MSYYVKFHFGAASRTRILSHIPRKGDIIDLFDDTDGRLNLLVERVIFFEDEHKENNWNYTCLCKVIKDYQSI